eukprot:COSAG06_NODE_1484_length_9302_cov_11.173639_7_plen_81_part_00
MLLFNIRLQIIYNYILLIMYNNIGEAAEVAAASLAFYGHLTGVEFALPKADMVAVPGKGGAMENWVRSRERRRTTKETLF